MGKKHTDQTPYPLKNTLKGSSASVHGNDKEGWTPLHEAAWRSPGRVTELLLEHGAELEPRTNAHQRSIPEPFYDTDELMHGFNTPLHLAACCANLEAFTLLLEHGASLDSSDTNGLMALHMAAYAGYVSQNAQKSFPDAVRSTLCFRGLVAA